MKTLDIGITPTDLSRVANAFARLLADSYLLALKTQNFHWNVTGPHFQPLHELFAAQYAELATAIDVLAERIRTLGHAAPGSFAQFSKLSGLQEETGTPNAEGMIKQLLVDHELLAKTARELFPIATGAHEEAGANILAERIEAHEKAAWMLRSLLS
jgi:starvation-inducible DNA-binding protein